ncbi:DUF6875 domain-containing protein [Actinopolyspora mortivallis]|uniref:DUF6875 domain-containing protein n=1 Tax=Actinopolyspora mortivallis TaxID=33906 RepID=UPI003CCC25C4
MGHGRRCSELPKQIDTAHTKESVLTGIRDVIRLTLLDDTQFNVKDDFVTNRIRIGQFHQDCETRAARNLRIRGAASLSPAERSHTTGQVPTARNSRDTVKTWIPSNSDS